MDSDGGSSPIICIPMIQTNRRQSCRRDGIRAKQEV